MAKSKSASPHSPVASKEPRVDRAIQALVAHVAQGGSMDRLFEREACDDEAAYALGHEFYRQARYEDALRVFALLVMRNNLERRFICALAACLQMLGRHEAAIQHYLNASLLDPDDPVTVFHACECLIAMGRVSEAREGLVLVLELSRAARYEAIRKKGGALIELIDKKSQLPNQGSKNECNL